MGGCCSCHGSSPHSKKRSRPLHKAICCGVNVGRQAGSAAKKAQKTHYKFQAGDEAEYAIEHGPFKGYWVKCLVTGFVPPSSFSVRVHETKDFNFAAGNSGKSIAQVSVKRLRQVQPPQKFSLYELAEIVVLTGQHKDRWLACQVIAFGEEPNQYNLQVLHCDPHDPAGRKDNISGQTLRKVKASSICGFFKWKPAYVVGETVEMQLLDGDFTGNWVKCQVSATTDKSNLYDVYVMPTEDFGCAGGNAEKTLKDVDAIHMRKACKAEVSYYIGEDAEMRLLDGPCKDRWVKCQVCGPGDESGKYNIRVLPSCEQGNAAGNAGKVFLNIDVDHLRKAKHKVAKKSLLTSSRVHKQALLSSLKNAEQLEKASAKLKLSSSAVRVTHDFALLEKYVLDAGLRLHFGLSWERKLGQTGVIEWDDKVTHMVWLSNEIGLVPKKALVTIGLEEQDEMPHHHPILRQSSSDGALADKNSIEDEAEEAPISKVDEAMPSQDPKHFYIGQDSPKAKEKKPPINEGAIVQITEDEAHLKMSVESAGLPWPGCIHWNPWTKYLNQKAKVLKAADDVVVMVELSHKTTVSVHDAVKGLQHMHVHAHLNIPCDALTVIEDKVAESQAQVGSMLSAGTRVTLRGLTRDTELNGVAGTCHAKDGDRWQVRLDTGEIVRPPLSTLEVANEAPEIVAGMRVKLRGLDRDTSLNGLAGICVVPHEGRWKVQLDNGELVRVRVTNLELIVQVDDESLAAEATAEKKKAEERVAKEAATKAEEERLAAEKKAEEEQRLATEAAAKAEEDRIAAEKKAEEERLAKEAAAKAEAERIAAEKKAEEDRIAAEKKAEEERLAEEAAAKAEAERIAAEKKAEEDERLAKEAAAKAEQDRIAAEKKTKKKKSAKEAAAKAEAERIAAEKKAEEEERLAKEAAAKAEADRIAAEKKAEEDRLAKEAAAKAEEERIAAEKKAEEERLAKEAAAKGATQNATSSGAADKPASAAAKPKNKNKNRKKK